jgi:hypothetical protein
MTPKRIEEIRQIIAELRDAEETGEATNHLYARARYALLELLDAAKKPSTLYCSVCQKPISGVVCDDCWDERLRVTE